MGQHAGVDLQWSGGGRSLHWTLGAEYVTRDLTESFSVVRGATSQTAEPESTGLDIGFSQASDVPTGTVAFVGARILPLGVDSGNDGGVIEDGTVLVTGNRITAVGRRNRVDIPDDAFRVDASGKTIIPGIVDVHAHVGGAGNGILAQSTWPLRANEAFGVTTSHDPPNNTPPSFPHTATLRRSSR